MNLLSLTRIPSFTGLRLSVYAAEHRKWIPLAFTKILDNQILWMVMLTNWKTRITLTYILELLKIMEIAQLVPIRMNIWRMKTTESAYSVAWLAKQVDS